MNAARPNILWIVTTQWRAQACGYAGDPNARTPHLDALAAESVNFAQAVTPHPFGPFARAAMLTGVPSPENGVRDYFDPLPAGARTIAHELEARGYATAFFGKWHLWKRDPTAPMVGEAHAKIVVPPEARGGFGFWEGFESGFLLNDPWLHGTRLAQPERFIGYQSDVVCARAAEWIAEWGLQNADSAIRNPKSKIQNWFAVVSLEAPHPPYDAPSSGVTPRDAREIILPANVPHGFEERARRELAGYYAHIEATDRAIGRLLAVAPRETTAVVFTSVHGDMHGAHGLFRKGWPHEESVRVPLLVRWPERAEDGDQKSEVRSQRTENRGRRSEVGGERRDDAAVSLLDLPALTLARIENPKSRIQNQVARISMPSVVRRPHQCDRVWRGVRTPRRKLVLNADPLAGSGPAGSPWLFFDLENDPLEQRNLAGEAAWAAEISELRALAG